MTAEGAQTFAWVVASVGVAVLVALVVSEVLWHLGFLRKMPRPLPDPAKYAVEDVCAYQVTEEYAGFEDGWRK